ncbi:hypothetical protein [Dokdonia sp. Hel_I_53]|uniref:hypothetical protein n=1 Tax=Dokdonia sp. Hel_I_53 TaxID=1566287 RepID=UPI00119A0894|nr:hypothetical protein [Dokdonia sp. Hel_I_53]TVZ52274.1 hypothetical protein OD90_1444 [Dokdonia sp. Hel_I_53]
MINKSLLFTSVFVCYSYVFVIAQGQVDDTGNNSYEYNYASELARIIEIPNSPEAAAFQKYGNVPVDLYRGMPNIDIPIYTIKGKEIDVPINLNYDPMNLKVEDIATGVGLGWNLNVGGRITRNTNGLPDDYITSDYKTPYNDNATATKFYDYREKIFTQAGFNSDSDLFNYFKFLEDVGKNKIDLLPDTYSLNIPGLNSQIIIINNEVYSLDNPRLKIKVFRSNHSISGWEVINNGTKYTFNKAEVTNYNNDDDLGDAGALVQVYNSSWLLTSIESPNHRDVYTFYYNDLGFWNKPRPISASSQISETRVSSTGNLTWVTGSPIFSTGHEKIKQQFLTKIIYNGNNIIDISLKERHDLSIPSAISNISITNTLGNRVSSFNFFYSYFGISSDSDPNNFDEEELRLKLDGIGISGEGINMNIDLNSYDKKYVFTYNAPEQVPSRDSKAQDIFGYYNGVNNSSLIPKVDIYGKSFSGANRDFNVNYATKGILEKITYPTGGHSTFKYEQAYTNEYGMRPNEQIYFSLSTNNQIPIDFFNQRHNPSNTAYTDECLENECCPSPNIINSKGDTGLDAIGIYNSEIFEVSESTSYDIISKLNTSFIVDASVNYLKSFIIELNECVPLSYAEALTACESGSFVVWDYHDSVSNTVALDADKCYQAVIFNAMMVNDPLEGHDESTLGTIDFDIIISRTEDEPYIARTEMYPSYRLKEITNYTEIQKVSTKKEYKYGFVNENLNPIFSYLTNEAYFDETYNQIKQRPKLIRYSKPVMGSEPILSYSGVSEINRNVYSGEKNGETKYSFNTAGTKGNSPQHSPPFSRNYFPNYKKGKMLNSTTLNSTTGAISHHENDYVVSDFSENIINTLGYTYKNNENKKLHVIVTYADNPGQYSYLPYELSGFQSLGMVLGFPQICSSPTVNCFQSINPTIGYQAGNSSFQVGNINSTSRLNFLDEHSVESSVTYEYNSDYLLSKSIKTNSSHQTLTTEFYYEPSSPIIGDFNSPFPEDPLVIKQFKNSSLLSTKEIKFGKVSNGPEMMILPHTIASSKGGIPAEDKIYINRYDSFGNAIEIQQKDGPVVSYVWGYNGKYLLSKIVNIKYAEIELLPEFGSEFLLTQGLNSSQIQALYKLPNAQVTNYTYKPMVGLTSKTSPSGETIYYEYDIMNRLENIKDIDGNIIIENKYNYRDQD